MRSRRGGDSPTRAFGDIVRQAGMGFFPLEFVAKLPLAMTLAGVLSLVAEQRGSIAEAGFTTGILGVASGLCAPLVGAAADRYGQRRVLVPIALVNGAALLFITGAVYMDAPLWLILGVAVLIGVSSPQIGPMGRARWIGMNQAQPTGRNLNAAMGWESMTDEVSFIVGPILVALFTSLISPAAPVVAAAAIVLTFATGFALHRTHADAPRGVRTREPGTARLLSMPLVLVILGMTVVGMFWGVSITTVTELARHNGSPGSGGFIYGAMGLAASITALASGALPARVSHTPRWLVGASFAGAASVVLLVTADATWTGFWYFLIGLGMGPVLVSLFSLAAELAPRGRSATVMTLVVSGSVMGQAVVTAINGVALERFGYGVGFVSVAVLLGVLAALGLVASVTARRNADSRRGALDQGR
jgi:MFS family permease